MPLDAAWPGDCGAVTTRRGVIDRLRRAPRATLCLTTRAKEETPLDAACPGARGAVTPRRGVIARLRPARRPDPAPAGAGQDHGVDTAASCPQAPSISRPRVSRTVVG